MSRKKAVLLTLLGVCVVGLVLLSSQMPALVFRYQDGQEQGQTTFSEAEGLTLTLNQDSGVSFWDKLAVLQRGSFSSISLQEKMMTHTREEAVALCSAGLSQLYDNFGFDAWHLEEDTLVESNCLGYLQEDDSVSFRVWYVMLYRKGGEYCGFTLDDETGLILNLYCEGDGLCASIADRWLDDEGDDEAVKRNLSMAADLSNQVMALYFVFQLRQALPVSDWYHLEESTDYGYQAVYQVLLEGEENANIAVEEAEQVYDMELAEAEVDPEEAYAVEPAEDCCVTVRMGPDSWGINV
ncbi:MAG: hypothetical protein ACI3VN_04380 [Candidatus Onthomonas sp.]